MNVKNGSLPLLHSVRNGSTRELMSSQVTIKPQPRRLLESTTISNPRPNCCLCAGKLSKDAVRYPRSRNNCARVAVPECRFAFPPCDTTPCRIGCCPLKSVVNDGCVGIPGA